MNIHDTIISAVVCLLCLWVLYRFWKAITSDETRAERFARYEREQIDWDETRAERFERYEQGQIDWSNRALLDGDGTTAFDWSVGEKGSGAGHRRCFFIGSYGYQSKTDEQMAKEAGMTLEEFKRRAATGEAMLEEELPDYKKWKSSEEYR